MTAEQWGLFTGLIVFVVVAEVYSRVMLGVFFAKHMTVAKTQTLVAMASAMAAGFYVWSIV